MTAWSYCAQQVKEGDRDRFLAALFVPAREREALMAVYTLNLELARVRSAVTEEMLGHIRHAWWQENVEALYGGVVRQGQPVLEALAKVVATGHLPQPLLITLLEGHQAYFPELPPDIDAILKHITQSFLDASRPEAVAGWHKAQNVIDCHRKRFGARLDAWLMLKLLLAGLR